MLQLLILFNCCLFFMQSKTLLPWLFVAFLTAGVSLMPNRSQILIAGQVIDLKNGIYFGRNDGIPKSVIVDGGKCFSLRKPIDAYPNPGAAYNSYSGGPLNSELNNAAQEIMFSTAFIKKPCNYTGPDRVADRYEYYINLK